MDKMRFEIVIIYILWLELLFRLILIMILVKGILKKIKLII